MPDIPGFPRKTIKSRNFFDLNIDKKDMDDVIAGLQSIKAKYLTGATFEIAHLRVCQHTAFVKVIVYQPETDEAYEARHTKWQQKLVNVGFTETHMERCLRKVDKALSKLDKTKDETIH